MLAMLAMPWRTWVLISYTIVTMTLDIAGVTEVAAMLNVSRQRLDKLRERPDFPEPDARLSFGPIWSRSAVEEWDKAHPRRAGRPKGSVVPTRP